MAKAKEEAVSFGVDTKRLMALAKQASDGRSAARANEAKAKWVGDLEFGRMYPNLYAMLAAGLVDKECDPGTTLTIWLNPEGWVGVLNPRWMKLKAFKAASSLEGLLRSLETFLEAEEPDWREDDGRRRSRRR